MPINIFLIGGFYDNQTGKSSGLISRIYRSLFTTSDIILRNNDINITYQNGGSINDIKNQLHQIEITKPDIIFWFPYIENSEEKLRNIKELSPESLLITSKRNDNNKYSFQELLQHALMLKANMTFEFSIRNDGRFNIRVFDPLGCEYYNGTDSNDAIMNCLKRIKFLMNITRQRTTPAPEDKSLILSYYFDRFAEQMESSDKNPEIRPSPEIENFINIVKDHAEVYQKLMGKIDIQRFVGNASMKIPPQVGRCAKGMPSFKDKDFIFVSKRNIDKQFITIENFVPVYMKDDKIYFCGPDKPSVDTPIQIRLYQWLPNIRFILHSHNYIKEAAFTRTSMPCGAVEEAAEIIRTIKQNYHSLNEKFYALNLLGHGAIILAHDANDIKPYKDSYYMRPVPEKV